MQSSSMNEAAVRLNTSSHSRAVRRCGPDGTWPVALRSVAVDKREGAQAGFCRPFAPAAR